MSLQTDIHDPFVWKRKESLCSLALSTVRPTVQTTL